jgi:hypothetical protein
MKEIEAKLQINSPIYEEDESPLMEDEKLREPLNGKRPRDSLGKNDYLS